MIRKLPIIAGVAILCFSMTGAMASSASVPPAGKIYFGTKVVRVGTGYGVQGKKSAFHLSQSMGWVAHFNQDAGSHTLSVMVWKGKKQLLKSAVSITHLTSNEYAVSESPHKFVDAGLKLGTKYTLKYSRGKTSLASGTFKIVR